MGMPVVAAQFGESPTLLYPEHLACRTLLETCGPVITLAGEEQFGGASPIACYYGWVIALMDHMTAWTAEQGLAPDTARQLVTQMTRAAATSGRERLDSSLGELVEEVTKPGSFTRAGLSLLNKEHAFDAWRSAAQHLIDEGTSRGELNSLTSGAIVTGAFVDSSGFDTMFTRERTALTESDWLCSAGCHDEVGMPLTGNTLFSAILL